MSSLPKQEVLAIKEVKFFVLDITLKGGIERFVANMAALFSISGYGVKIYSFHHTFEKPLYVIHPSVEIVYLSTHPFKNSLYKIVTFLGCLKLAILSRSFRQPYVAIATHPITTIFLSWFCPSLLQHAIASEHSTYSAHRAWIRALRLRSYRRVKCVVTQTSDGAERFVAAGLPTAQIPNACTDFTDPRQWALGQRLPGHRFTCLSVGRFEGVKQLDHYIEMAYLVHQKIPHIQFKLVGAGPMEAPLRERIQQCGLEKVFCVHAPTLNVNKFYANAEAYLITSESEAFPMTMIEALSYGVPVVAYDQLVGPKEIIVDGYNGFLCEQNNPTALASKVLDMYRKPKLCQKLQCNALRSAQAFHHETIFKKWLEIL